jgi:hypothetical protein
VEASQAHRDVLETDVPVSVDVGALSVRELIERYFADAETSGLLSPKSLHDSDVADASFLNAPRHKPEGDVEMIGRFLAGEQGFVLVRLILHVASWKQSCLHENGA